MTKVFYLCVFTTLFSFCTVLPSFAQKKYVPGFIITNQADTIYGNIEFNTDYKNMRVCHFKQTEDSKETAYYPGDIMAYRFINEGKYYVSSEINLKGKTEKHFLEFLVQGMMNLYFYTSPMNGSFYILENNEGERTIVHNDPRRAPDKRKYVGQLSYAFRDYPLMYADIEKAELKKKDMVDITVNYHDLACTDGGECILFENDYKRKFFNVDLFVYTGIQLSKHTFGRKVLDFLGAKNIYSPVIGATIDLSSPRIWKPLGLSLDVSATRVSASPKTAIETASYHGFKRAKSSYFSLTPRIGLKYTHQSGKIRPVIETGGSLLLDLNTKGKMKIDRTWTSGATDTETLDFKMFHATSLGFYAAIGGNIQLRNNHAIALRIMGERLKGEGGLERVSSSGTVWVKGTRVTVYQFKIGYIF